MAAGDMELEKRCMQIIEWMAAVIGEGNLPQKELCELLADGLLLCRLVEKFGYKPQNVALTYDRKPTTVFKKIQNIEYFLAACQTAGVRSINLFRATDLVEKKKTQLVIACIEALAAIAEKKGGPKLAKVASVKIVDEIVDASTSSSAPARDLWETPSPASTVANNNNAPAVHRPPASVLNRVKTAQATS